MALKIITDWQEGELHKDLEELTDEEYESFLEDAEDADLVERRPKK